MLSTLSSPDTWIALATLTAMEIVLGVDNIIFIAILVGRLPAAVREQTRRLGIAIALLSRLGLLFAISWIMGLTTPLFTAFGHPTTGRHLILLLGGLFLIAKASHEMYAKLEGGPDEALPEAHGGPRGAAPMAMLVQIAFVDIVFSLDSVITAVGMAEHLWVMIVAMVVAVGVMLLAARAIGDFVERHPSMKILALSFLLLIGVLLVAEGTGQHLSKGYVYFAMAFSISIELLNMRFRRNQQPVHLHATLPDESSPTPEHGP